ncbi:Inosine/uridine-preferring nucleoside hydrolase [Metarhizium album ARSEF 1941]|uniref:Inosine/uridine-preferring nucleoside hydrolase n=1 Tax=Metarhizium album (strain ARSEF 1941) TaxID=1081103 RepID=A0A0B2WUW1_METAS|nr:Inosine/uridine-preferring nucleoside hydrolase [Metarhizium album ARSEF 1941]KHN99866.1 Inosine/uridine-preferring nucleoside hydrolase [Metarhizium album ARSEF 1941]
MAVSTRIPVCHTTWNASSVLTAIGKEKDVPLYRGAAKALERPPAHAPEVHGESGLEGTFLLPKPACEPVEKDAVEAMYEALMAQPKDTAWLVATGSLTNVGVLLRKYPQVASHIKGISIMGGSVGGGFSDAVLGHADNKDRIGNISFWAEFNILIDPEAAAEVFHNKEVAKKTTLVPLDLTHQVLASNDVRHMLLYGPGGNEEGKGKTTLRDMLVELLYFFAETYSNVFGITEGPPLHDPIAVAAVLIGTSDEIPFAEWHEEKSVHPRYNERFDVTVVTEGTFEEAEAGTKQTGRTIVKALPAGEEGVRIPRSIDITRFWQEIEACISRADAVNEKNGKTFWEEYRP